MSGQMSVSHASKPVQRYKIFLRFASFSAKKAYLICILTDTLCAFLQKVSVMVSVW